jgi:Autographiviridae endonuclease
MKTVNERLEENCVPVTETGCWLWIGSVSHGGYGQLSVNGKKRKVHRLSYEISVGKIPKGMLVCHKCDVPCCINPEHLFVGTQQDNMDDMITKGRDRHQKGILQANSKLTEEEVNEIRLSRNSYRALAAEYNISRASIYYIKNGLSWRHIAWPSHTG